MSIVVALLFFLLLGGVAFGAYQFSAAARWKREALDQKTELETAKRTALEKEAEAARICEVTGSDPASN
jgi:hypothetical protein